MVIKLHISLGTSCFAHNSAIASCSQSKRYKSLPYHKPCLSWSSLLTQLHLLLYSLSFTALQLHGPLFIVKYTRHHAAWLKSKKNLLTSWEDVVSHRFAQKIKDINKEETFLFPVCQLQCNGNNIPLQHKGSCHSSRPCVIP